MVFVELVLKLAGFGLLLWAVLWAVLWVVFGLVLPLFITAKTIKDDPHFFEFPDLPDVGDMAEEGWELAYSVEDNDYHVLGQVFYMESRSKYRVILSDTSYSGGVSFDEECKSYEEAKEIADEYINGYLEED